MPRNSALSRSISASFCCTRSKSADWVLIPSSIRNPDAVTSETRPAAEATLAGDWSLLIESPLGQSIPATLILANTVKGLSGRVESEMGSGELLSASFDGESFMAIVSFDVSGLPMEAQIAGEVADQQMEGTISIQDTPPLPFTGNRADSPA